VVDPLSAVIIVATFLGGVIMGRLTRGEPPGPVCACNRQDGLTRNGPPEWIARHNQVWADEPPQ
jgi:hypothetical protein